MKKRYFSFSTSRIIILSFLLAILAGSLLLSLPISSASGKAVPYIDALFTATTATCVTGLVTLPTVSTWSVFGQIVILLLIQIGGLGIITIMSGIMIALQRKMGLSDRLLIQDAFNLNSLSGLVQFVKKVIFGTFIIEGAGALVSMTVFVPDFGIKGIWISIFHSVSAFCNAGIDIFAEDSLCQYATNPIINFVTVALIILGGIGYIVWWDVIRVCKKFRVRGFKCFRHLTLHSKIALSMTAILLLVGTAAIFLFERQNPLTLREYGLFDQLQISFFQSVTTRTAGFASLPQQNLSNPSAIVSLLLMFIGGSPVGTAGGIKTVTLAILAASAVSTVKNRNEVSLFHRNISKQALSKAIAVVGMSFSILTVSTLLLSAVTEASMLDILYETVSATATVGLTRNLTSSLDFWGKLIVIANMYLGRVGPISLAIAFSFRKENQNMIKNPTEEISVG
ncbi:MAG: potassium transporter KtrB [Oscillospiraceae bacterium]|nr:potassium transporter KtrB [Oscillospiraceae bacterium]